MSSSFSFPSRDSHLSRFSFSNISFQFFQCLDCRIYGHLYIALSLANIVLLAPLSILVLSLGFQRWRKQRSGSSAAVTSPSDFITYNTAVVELIGVLGYTMTLCSTYSNLPMMGVVGVLFGAFPWNGQMFFPFLTCVERYVAIVYPITYLRLRRAGLVCIRNVSTVIIWLQCLSTMGFLFLVRDSLEYRLIPNIITLVFILIGMIFCSASVLSVLTRPRPGEVGGNRLQVDQSKQRAFHTMIIITGVLCLRFGGTLVCSVVGSLTSYDVQCLVMVTGGWVNLPSSLVLPLLFLHRARKLPGCKH
ncbi:hypothetical protein L3Q82_003767 [Scortum barcoo]|uniref:Uncharacterized protein n=1 Tax=Scortum barcoo TaxID=214431 RepID=A0ACB8X830_9TELE|nr:hypothetical protein L3Q82_003767 [Scortum barcoo]